MQASLSHYRIVEQIGAGGMGVVYRAHDERLERDVALKVLPSGALGNEAARKRFRKEALALSKLSHPNIATVFDFDSEDGTDFLVEELIPGLSLDGMLGNGPLSEKEIVHLGSQLCEALAAAHEQGVVHRDLKPGNVMVTPDARVKILDFGLAKVLRTSGEGSAEDVTASLTETQTVSGTLPYMAPEQLLNQKLDARTDIWAVGCVLHEMATGQRPFPGAGPALTEAILHQEPPLPTEVNSKISPELEGIILKCLEKETELRYGSAREVGVDLRRLSRSSESGRALTGKAASTVRRTAVRRSSSDTALMLGVARRNWLRLMTIGFVVAVAALAAWHFWPRPKPNRWKSVKLERLTSSGDVGDAAISPDGKYVAYMACEGTKCAAIWLHQIATQSRVQVLPQEPIRRAAMTFSRDSAFIYYLQKEEGGGLERQPWVVYKVPAIGGVPQKILVRVESPVAESPDGSRLAFVSFDPVTGTSQLEVASADGSGRKVLTKRKVSNSRVTWSPDGQLIAAGAAPGDAPEQTELIAVPVGGGPERVLSTKRWRGVGDLAWLSDNSGLLVNGEGQVWFLSYPGGEARQITNDDWHWYGDLTASADGAMLATEQNSRDSRAWVASALAPDKAAEIPSAGAQWAVAWDWTRSGDIIVTADFSSSFGLWVVKPDGSGAHQLPTPKASGAVAIAPDGRIVYVASDGKKRNLWIVDREGGNARQLTFGDQDRQPVISPDGKWVVYFSVKEDGAGLWKVPLDGGSPAALVKENSVAPRISPDGKWIAYVQGKITRDQRVFVAPFEGGGPVRVVDIPYQSAGSIEWMPDGQRLSYVQGKRGVSNLWARPVDGGEATQLTYFTSGQIYLHKWSKDGKQVAMTRGTEKSELVLVREVREQAGGEPVKK